MRKITTINRAEQTMLIQGLEQLLDHYNRLIETEKKSHVKERYEFLQDKALELYKKLDERDITDIRIEEVQVNNNPNLN